MGNRVEFTGRTVISLDQNLKISEAAVPVLMAHVLTYPERVTVHNIEKLRQCIRNGPFKHPGTNFVFPPDENSESWKVILLAYLALHLLLNFFGLSCRNLKIADRKDVANTLKLGYIVHRHLQDGDFVLLNRQPSLHRMSTMCHRNLKSHALEISVEISIRPTTHQEIHERHIATSDNLILFVKCGALDSARMMLDEMLEKNIVSWTAMIAGYSQKGFHLEALKLFYQMMRTGGGITSDCRVKKRRRLGFVILYNLEFVFVSGYIKPRSRTKTARL